MKRKVLLSNRVRIKKLNANVSPNTIYRALKSVGLKYFKKGNKPLLSKKIKKQRLDFAKKMINLTEEEWKNIIFTDETRVKVFGGDGKNGYWSKKRNINKARKVVKYGGGSIMLWSCFSFKGVGPIIEFTKTPKSKDYVSMLQQNWDKIINKCAQNMDFSWQQDNAPIHTSKEAKDFFKSKNIKVIDWPPYSPDLNPIQNLWSIVKQKLYNDDQILKKSIIGEKFKEKWNSIDQNMCKTLITSMKKRLKLVEQAQGGSIWY